MNEIMNAVVDTFRVFGPDTSKVLLFHFEHRFGLKPDEIPSRPEQLHLILDELFGSFSRSMEQSICSQIRRSNPSHSSEFLQYFEHQSMEVKAA
ncbi:MAG: hypothetical protein ACREAY_09690 [Nitrososphaera sp.]|uniref:hypothetical protein n=1 Tax=Nitrososphaera sp. TaxID=1971748 RepID=UPI003D6FA30F